MPKNEQFGAEAPSPRIEPQTHVLTRAQVREYDRRAIEEFGVPSIVLMENAARGAADAIEPRLAGAPELTVDLYCGTGNNGGDGFALARHLHARGTRVRIIPVGDVRRLTPDARTNFEIACRLGLEVNAFDPNQVPKPAPAHRRTLVIDAIVGTGLARAIEGEARAAVDEINARRAGDCAVVALDVPSGLDCDSGEVLGAAVRADETITFVAPKPGLLTPCGRDHAGVLTIVGIGLPRDLPRAPASDGRATGALAFGTLPRDEAHDRPR